LHTNYSLKHIFEEDIEARIKVTGRRGKKRKQLSDELKEIRILEIRKHYIALCGGPALEEAMDKSQDRLHKKRTL
jgi:hypothetical protein